MKHYTHYCYTQNMYSIYYCFQANYVFTTPVLLMPCALWPVIHTGLTGYSLVQVVVWRPYVGGHNSGRHSLCRDKHSGLVLAAGVRNETQLPHPLCSIDV